MYPFMITNWFRSKHCHFWHKATATRLLSSQAELSLSFNIDNGHLSGAYTAARLKYFLAFFAGKKNCCWRISES